MMQKGGMANIFHGLITIMMPLLESSCDAVGLSMAREEQYSYQPSH